MSKINLKILNNSDKYKVIIFLILILYILITSFYFKPFSFESIDEFVPYYESFNILNNNYYTEHINSLNNKFSEPLFGYSANSFFRDKKTSLSGYNGVSIFLFLGMLTAPVIYFYFFIFSGFLCLLVSLQIAKLFLKNRKDLVALTFVLFFLNPFFIHWSIAFYNNIIFLLFFLLSFYYFSKDYFLNSKKCYYLGILFYSFSVVVRPDFLLNLIALLIIFLFFNKKNKIELFSLIFIPIFILLLFYCPLNYYSNGEWFRSGSLSGTKPTLFTEQQNIGTSIKSLGSYLSWKDVAMPTLIAQLPYFFKTIGITYPLFSLGLLASVLLIKKRDERFFICYYLLTFLLLYLFFGKAFMTHAKVVSMHASLPRYLLPSLFLSPLLIVKLFERYRINKKMLVVFFFIAFIIFFNSFNDPRINNNFNKYNEYKTNNLLARRIILKNISCEDSIFLMDQFGQKILVPNCVNVIYVNNFDTTKINCSFIKLIKNRISIPNIYFLASIWEGSKENNRIIQQLSECYNLKEIKRFDPYYGLRLIKID